MPNKGYCQLLLTDSCILLLYVLSVVLKVCKCLWSFICSIYMRNHNSNGLLGGDELKLLVFLFSTYREL